MDKQAEEIVVQAKRLDKVLSKYKVGNGIVTSKNFNINGTRVYLTGSQLKKVGLGYTSAAEGIVPQVMDIVDKIEAYLESKGIPAEVPAVKAAPAEVDEPAPSIPTDADMADEKLPGADDVTPGEPAEEDPAAEYAQMTVSELKELCKQIGVVIPRNATKKALIKRLTAE